MTGQKKRQLQAASKQSVLESLKDLGGGTADDLSNLFKDT